MTRQDLLSDILKLNEKYSRDEATRLARELSYPEYAQLTEPLDWMNYTSYMATVGFYEAKSKEEGSQRGLSSDDLRLVDRAKAAQRKLDPPENRGGVLRGLLLLAICALLCALWQPREALIGWMMGVQVGGTALGTCVALALVIGVSILVGVLLGSFVAGLVTLGVIFVLEWALRTWAGIVLSDQMVLRICWFAVAGVLGILGVVQLKRRAEYNKWHRDIPSFVKDCGELCEKCLELASCYDTVAFAALQLMDRHPTSLELYAQTLKVTSKKDSGEVTNVEGVSVEELHRMVHNAADYFDRKSRCLMQAADDLEKAAKQRSKSA